MILPIIIHPNGLLRQKSHEISHEEILSSKFKKFVKNLSDTMIKKQGVGLAAPQVGQLKRIIVININHQPVPFINPKIIKKSWSKDIMEEGCLSIPAVYGKVKRSKTIILKYYDLTGAQHNLKAGNLLARVLQHEIDHLDGILFIDFHQYKH